MNQAPCSRYDVRYWLYVISYAREYYLTTREVRQDKEFLEESRITVNQ